MRAYIFKAAIFFFLFLLSCQGKSSEHSVKFKQYYLKGEQLYAQHCSNCHQKDGSGLRLLYPPLASSDYMSTHFEETLCLIKHGHSGPMTVNGKGYNQPMPSFENLSDLEIAQIATYIYNTWENSKGIIEVKEASSILGNCK